MPKKTFTKTLSILFIFIITLTSFTLLSSHSVAENLDDTVLPNYSTESIVVEDFNDTDFENYPYGFFEPKTHGTGAENITVENDLTTSSRSGEYAYEMNLIDESSSNSGGVGFQYHTCPDNLSGWDDIIKPYGIKSVSFSMYVEYEGGLSNSQNGIDMAYFRYDGDERDIVGDEYVEAFDDEDITRGEWERYTIPVSDVDRTQTILWPMLYTTNSYEGELTIKIDAITFEYRTSTITPWTYNKFTGLGIEREKLRLEYEDPYGNWKRLGYDPSFQWILGLETKIRAVDFWDQVIEEVTVQPFSPSVDIDMAIPLLDIEIRHEEEWGTPDIEINSQETGMSQHISSYNFEIIGGREYDFIWRNFDKFLNGSAQISFAYGEVKTDGSIETPDENLSDIKGGNAMLDLDMSIDPEYYEGMPTLDWSDPLKLGDNIAAGIGYLWFGLDYSDWKVYQDPVWPDWFAAISETSTGRATVYVIGFVSLMFSIYWIVGLRNERRRLDMVDEKVNS